MRTRTAPRTIARCALVGLALLVPAPAAVASDAKATIQETVDQVLAVLGDASLSIDSKRERIEQIAEQRFDFERMTRLVLARNFKKLSEQQRADFLTEFRRHLSLTYGRRLDRFSEETVEVGDVHEHSNGDVTVKTVIVGGAADGVTMNYRMRARDQGWRAIDVIIEGISLIANFRSQIQEIVSNKGADELIRVLREKNLRDAAPEPV